MNRSYPLALRPEDEPLERTLPGRVFLHAERRPSNPALRNKDRGIWNDISWSEYREMVSLTAYMLKERLGVSPGDHVSILSDNRPEWLYADLGTQAIGARAVGIYQTNSAADVAFILQHSRSKVLFCEDQEQVDKAIEVAEQTPSLEHIVVFDPRGTRDYTDGRLIRWDDFVDEAINQIGDATAWLRGELLARDPMEASMIVYTSGTTGEPKGAMISSHNVVDTGQAMAPILSVTPGDAVLSYLPLCHVAEKIFTVFLPLVTGATVHFGESIGTVQQDLKEVSPSVFLGVPRIWEKMHASVTLKMKDSSWLKRKLFDYWTLEGQVLAERRRAGRLSLLDKLKWKVGDLLVFRPLQERLGLRNCRHPITGAAPISADLIRWFHGIGVPILEGYGQTECAGVSHLNPPGGERIGTVGQTLPLVECKTADDGEILVRGPMVFEGYLHRDEDTRRTIDADGWLQTGDIGVIDDDGYLSITGRKKEIIITAGGKNLSPEKIENALKMSPYIKESVAIGDHRKYVSALVQIDFDAVGDWATRRQIPYTSFEDLASKSEVAELIDSEISSANELLARVETVRKFKLFTKELHQDDGELTATQKVRRQAITEMYDDLIESMY